MPCDLNTIFETSLIEAMTLALPESSTVLSMDDLDFILAAAVGKQGCVSGQGIGTGRHGPRKLFSFFTREIDLPMVIGLPMGFISLPCTRMPCPVPGGPACSRPHPGEWPAC